VLRLNYSLINSLDSKTNEWRTRSSHGSLHWYNNN